MKRKSAVPGAIVAFLLVWFALGAARLAPAQDREREASAARYEDRELLISRLADIPLEAREALSRSNYEVARDNAGARSPALVLNQAQSAQTQANASPLAGSWKANIAKSQRHPNHLFQSLTLSITVSRDLVSLAYKGINMSGEEESGTQEFDADGKEYPVAKAPGVVKIARWIGTNTLETVAKKDGKVSGQGTYEVSSEGKTLTAPVKGVDQSGASVEQVIVLDRQ